MQSLWQNLRYGLRMLRKSPGFTIVAIVTLALGIGANTAIFSLIDAVMLRMLPVQRPDELLQLERQDPRYADVGSPSFSNPLSLLWSGGASPDFSNPLWEQVRDQQNVFSGVFAWSNNQFDLARGGTVQPADGSFVSGDFFTTLGLRPAAGRLIAGSDDYRGCPPVALLSNGFWQGHYGGPSGAVGSTLSLNDHPFEIIGVAPPGFYGMDVGRESQVFVPICTSAILGAPLLEARSMWWLNVAGRIKPGISRAPFERPTPGTFPSHIHRRFAPILACRRAAEFCEGEAGGDFSCDGHFGCLAVAVRPALAGSDGHCGLRAANCLRKRCQPDADPRRCP